jgi:hypothetical protein
MPENVNNVQIEPQWKAALSDEFDKPYFAEIKQFLVAEKAAGKVIFPPGPLIFNAFNKTPFDQVKVVILGQEIDATDFDEHLARIDSVFGQVVTRSIPARQIYADSSKKIVVRTVRGS